MKSFLRMHKMGYIVGRGIAGAAGLLALFLGVAGLGAESAAAAGNLKQEMWNQADSLRVPFVENRGQIPDSQVRFYARTFGGTVYVLQSGDVVYALPGRRAELPSAHSTGLAVLKESFGAGRRPAPLGDRPSGATVNSFLGADPARWRANLPAFEQVSLGEVSAGVQLILRARGHSVEKIFTVAPGADPLQIRVSLEGAEGLAVNDRGELEAATELGIARFSAPVAWQTDAAGRDVPVAIAYAADDDAFGFAIGPYDPGRPLMIDPLLSSTFVGGSGSDALYAVAVENSTSNIVVAGATDSLNFPTNGAHPSVSGGGLDIVVSKFDVRMTNLIASMFMGGSSNDIATAVAIAQNGEVVVAGYTLSGNFPMIGGGYTNSYRGNQDGFMVKFSSGLVPSVSTYLGGSLTDTVNAVAVFTNGVIYAAGYTESPDFPMAGSGYTNAYQGEGDGFLALFDNGLSALSASTFLGGEHQDAVQGIALSANTNVYVAGFTWSTNFPMALTNSVYTNGVYTNFAGECDAFVSRFTPDLTNLDASTFLGGDARDGAYAIGLDTRTNVYVAGYTYSTNLLLLTVVPANAAQTNLAGGCDAFVASLFPALTNRITATYLGGSADDQANGLAIGYGLTPGAIVFTNILVVGDTASADLPVTANATYTTAGGGGDAFVSVLTSPLTNRYAVTYLGGAGYDRGLAAAIVDSNSVVAAGYTASGNFPISDATYGTRYNGGACDGFVSRLAGTLTYGTKKWELALGAIHSSPCMGPDGTLYITSGDGYIYAVNSGGGTNWSFPLSILGNPYASPMITTNGVVIVGSDETNNASVFALNAMNGALLYSNAFGRVKGCAAVDANGYIYTATWQEKVAGILQACQLTPELVINRTFNHDVTYYSPALGTNNDLYFGSDSAFYSFNTLTGVTNGRVEFGAVQFKSSPALGNDGLAYIGSSSTNVFAMTAAGQTQRLWSTTGNALGSPVVGTNGVVYIGTSVGRLYAFQASDPDPLWNMNLVSAIGSAPALGEDGSIYVGAGTKLLSLNPTNTTTNWFFTLNNACLASSPLIGMDGTIYIGSGDGARLYAVYGPTAPEMNAPWPKAHHDMMNSGRLGFDHRPRPPANVTASQGAYSNSVLVTWSAVPYATCYEVYRSTTNDSSAAPKIASTAQTNYLDNIDVAEGQMYYYWIKTKAPLGNSDFSDPPAIGGTLPLPPTGVNATKGDTDGYPNSIRVTWNAATGAVGYLVWRSESPGSNTASQVGSSPASPFEDTTIVKGLKYYYWVQTTNMVGLSGFSTNGPYGGTPPLPPNDLAAGEGTSVNYLPVTWTAPTGASVYLVYSNLTDTLGTAGLATNLSAPTMTFNHYGLMPCRHYYYWLKATNEFGISGFTASDWGWRALAPPASISASDGNYTTKIGVSWVVGNTNLQETTAHLVYRSQTNDTATAQARIELAYTAATMTNYDDTEIVRGPLYYYWVRARNAYGTSDWSAVDSGGTVPLPPTGILATDGTLDDKILVTWIPSAYAATYDIYRSMDQTTNGAVVIDSVSGSAASYDDTTAQPGVIYYYWVRAVSPYGSSVFSGSDYGWRGLAAPLAVSAGDGASTSSVPITWTASAGATSYEVWRHSSTSSASATKLDNSVPTNAYEDTTAIAGVLYYYWVKAKTYSATSAFSSPDSGYRAVGKVDIGVSDFVLLPTVMAAGGHPDAVSFRIENYGDQAMVAPNNWVMSDFYLSANAVFGDGDDISIGSTSSSVPLSVQTSAGMVFDGATRQRLTIPDLPLGRYYAFIHIRHCYPSSWNDPVLANNTAVRLGQTLTVSNTTSTTTVLNDYNGDGRADLAVYHEDDGRWYIRTVGGAWLLYGDSWGAPGYQPVVGDYDDNGISDLAVYHEASGLWFIRSVSGGMIAWQKWWGSPDYKPVPGDYDGDRLSDLAVYHESDGLWYASTRAGVTIAWAEWWGAPGYQAVPGDYDGDGKCDFAVYHESDGFWYIRTVSGNIIAWATWWGGEDYQAVPGDYDGDGVSDLAVYNMPTGYWFIQTVSGRRIAWGEYWGLPDYVPVPGDYDGDGIYDLAVYHEASGLWYIRTLAGVSIVFGESWGAPGYQPVSSLP